MKIRNIRNLIVFFSLLICVFLLSNTVNASPVLLIDGSYTSADISPTVGGANGLKQYFVANGVSITSFETNNCDGAGSNLVVNAILACEDNSWVEVYADNTQTYAPGDPSPTRTWTWSGAQAFSTTVGDNCYIKLVSAGGIGSMGCYLDTSKVDSTNLPILTYNSNNYNYHIPTKLYGEQTPVPTSSVYTFGYPYLWSLNNSVFDPLEEKKFIVNWNTCNDYGNFDYAKIFASLNGQLVGSSTYDSIGLEVVKPISTFTGPQQCQGTITYFRDLYLSSDFTTSGTVQFYLKEYSATGTVLSTVSSNIINYTTAGDSNYISSLMEDPLMIDLGNLPQGIQTSTSTTLFFSYNFVGMSASTTVYLYDTRKASGDQYTGYYDDGPFSSTSTGFSGITIPTPATSTNMSYKFVAGLAGELPNLQTDPFIVNWSFAPTPKPPTNPFVLPKCETPQFDISSVCVGVGVWDLLGQTSCSMAGAFSYLGMKLFVPSCDSTYFILRSYDRFKASFPFNTFFDLTTAMNTAIVTAQGTSSTSTAQGSFSIPFIRQTATSSEYYMLPVMSSTSISNTIGSTNYNTYRTTLGYIWWLIIAGIVFLTIRKI